MAVAGSMSYSSGRMYAKPSDQRLQSIGIDVLCSPVSGHTAWPARGRSLSLLVSMMRGSGRLKVAISTAKMYAKQLIWRAQKDLELWVRLTFVGFGSGLEHLHTGTL